jgi:hypothetical protein
MEFDEDGYFVSFDAGDREQTVGVSSNWDDGYYGDE